MSDFAAGANIDGQHYAGINWGRDLPEARVEDIRNVVEGDPSPDGKGVLMIKRGIEVGHIFQLGTKYSDAMKAAVQGEDGRNQIMTMGCYGIGITRVVAAAIEQNHDERGIIWPAALAPFEVAILPMNMHKSFRVKELAEQLYNELRAKGIDVILDDRKSVRRDVRRYGTDWRTAHDCNWRSQLDNRGSSTKPAPPARSR